MKYRLIPRVSEIDTVITYTDYILKEDDKVLMVFRENEKEDAEKLCGLLNKLNEKVEKVYEDNVILKDILKTNGICEYELEKV